MTPRILVVTSVKNEGAHLLEWLAHTRAAGADAVLAFSNDCTDGTDALLDTLDAAGALSHVRNAVPDGQTPQWSALKQAADHAAMEAADWVAVLDCDEFVNLRPPLSGLHDLIAACPGADAVMLPWRLFGHAGHIEPVASTLDAFTRAIPADALYPPLARFFKTLYRRAAFQKPGVHRPKQKSGAAPAWVDGSGRPLPGALAADDSRILHWGAPLATDLVQLNHYSLRAAQDFVLKSARGLPNHTEKPVDLGYWVERNFNTVEDRSIARSIPATKAELARLMALPGVAAAQKTCTERTRQALAAALREPATVQLLGRLILAGGSTVPDPAIARHLVTLYQRTL